MFVIVFIAEALTAVFLLTFCLMLASDGLMGKVFEIKVKDGVGRFLIRNAQVAFVVGYTAFFAFSIYEVVDVIQNGPGV
ncbi:hypothetical protein BXY66_2316 [Shimia isoporae]|uniref:Uncharacterized protein n=1 Tax=Shimia isoporae TaxID=647720 RepID=A0A4R1NP62_9RHOB|nr:hypothetical protein [Shimia isoporae]TCL10247.1 hypothetical protein BXY66_2316 [Shimia isoporae]